MPVMVLEQLLIINTGTCLSSQSQARDFDRKIIGAHWYIQGYEAEKGTGLLCQNSYLMLWAMALMLHQ